MTTNIHIASALSTVLIGPNFFFRFFFLSTSFLEITHDVMAKVLNIIIEVSELGGARGVMVIVVGNGHGDMSSNPGRDWLHFT